MKQSLSQQDTNIPPRPARILIVSFAKFFWMGSLFVVFSLTGCKKKPLQKTKVTNTPPPQHPSTQATKVRVALPPKAIKRKKPQSKRPQKPSSLSFVTFGDIMVHGSQLRSAYNKKCRCYRWDSYYQYIKEWISSADIAIGNFETTLPGKKAGYGGFPNFAVPDSFGEALKRVGFDVLTNANNHIYDKGLPGLIRTVKAIRRLGLIAIGAYTSRKASQSKRFAMVNKNGIKVALFSYTSHINHPHDAYKVLRFHNQKKWPRHLVNFDDKKTIMQDLAKARKQGAEAIIVYHHFGPEYKHRPSKRQRRVVQYTFEAGADVVIGAHPHVVQPVEAKVVKDQFGRTKPRLVVYSLGNFVSGMRSLAMSGGIGLAFQLHKTFDSKGKSSIGIQKVKVLPFWVHRKTRKGQRKRYDFTIIPLPALRGKHSIPLDTASRKRAQRFGKRTTYVLRKGIKSVRKWFK